MSGSIVRFFVRVGLLQVRSKSLLIRDVSSLVLKKPRVVEIDCGSKSSVNFSFEEARHLLIEEKNEHWKYFAPFYCIDVGKLDEHFCCGSSMDTFETRSFKGSMNDAHTVCLICGSVSNSRFAVPGYLEGLRRHHGLKKQFPDKWEQYSRFIENTQGEFILTRPPTFVEYALGDTRVKVKSSVARLINDSRIYSREDDSS